MTGFRRSAVYQAHRAWRARGRFRCGARRRAAGACAGSGEDHLSVPGAADPAVLRAVAACQGQGLFQGSRTGRRLSGRARRRRGRQDGRRRQCADRSAAPRAWWKRGFGLAGRAWPSRSSCPADSNSASRWPARWLRRHGFFCSTSRSRRWTPRPAPVCGPMSWRMVEDSGSTLVLVTHDAADAAALCHRAIVLEGTPGRIAGERAVGALAA